MKSKVLLLVFVLFVLVAFLVRVLVIKLGLSSGNAFIIGVAVSFSTYCYISIISEIYDDAKKFDEEQDEDGESI